MDARTAGTHADLVRLNEHRLRLKARQLGAEVTRSRGCGTVEPVTEGRDHAQEVAARNTQAALWRCLSETQAQVQRALARMADGSYGLCEACGERIPSERLSACPEATRCVQCKQGLG